MTKQHLNDIFVGEGESYNAYKSEACDKLIFVFLSLTIFCNKMVWMGYQPQSLLNDWNHVTEIISNAVL